MNDVDEIFINDLTFKPRDWWIGFVGSFDKVSITCDLRKDFECDKILEIGIGFLTYRQRKYIKRGNVMRYDLTYEEIEFMDENLKWI